MLSRLSQSSFRLKWSLAERIRLIGLPGRIEIVGCAREGLGTSGLRKAYPESASRWDDVPVEPTPGFVAIQFVQILIGQVAANWRIWSKLVFVPVVSVS